MPNKPSTIRKSVNINTRILGDASASFLFNFSMISHRRTLEASNEVPNLLAVQVGDVAGECLPGDLELGEKVSANSTVAGDIAESISEVDRTAEEMANDSVQVSESAGSLLKLSEQLNTMVGRFKT